LQKCCEGEEGDDEDRKPVCTYFGKRFGKIANLLCCIGARQNWRANLKTGGANPNVSPISPFL